MQAYRGFEISVNALERKSISGRSTAGASLRAGRRLSRSIRLCGTNAFRPRVETATSTTPIVSRPGWPKRTEAGGSPRSSIQVSQSQRARAPQPRDGFWASELRGLVSAPCDDQAEAYGDGGAIAGDGGAIAADGDAIVGDGGTVVGDGDAIVGGGDAIIS